MCSACGGTCGCGSPRRRKPITLDLNAGSRRFRAVDAGGPAPLYVSRPLLPEASRSLRTWALAAGLADVEDADEMHVTVAFSRAPVDWFQFGSWFSRDGIVVPAGGPRRMEAFKKGVVVLRFASPDLSERWREFRQGGCSWDFPSYSPHVTIAKGAGDADLDRLKAYTGALAFGPEEFAPIQ